MAAPVAQVGHEEPLTASLVALIEAPPDSLARTSPRQLLSGVEPGWGDDLVAWGLAQRLVGLARRRLRHLQGAADGSHAGEEARARWAYGVALDLYEELRIRALSAEREDFRRSGHS